MDKNAFTLDSSILIGHLNKEIDINALFAARPGCEKYISIVAFIEALSKSGMTTEEDVETRKFLSQFTIVDITDEIRETAIALRRSAKLKLPDAIIAATALSLETDIISRDEHLLRLNLPGLRVVKNL
jgi:predicted nucleic acid-binding protein